MDRVESIYYYDAGICVVKWVIALGVTVLKGDLGKGFVI